jgi:tripartite-type tricarboxylate transporter receptor subunit TctC
VHAQNFPNRAVHVVVPFPPGAINDGLARVMADEMSKAMGQPFVVENRPGASGALALDYVASQPADGYTMVMGGNGPSVIVPSLNPNAKYSPKDFDPVAFVAGLPSVLVVHPSVPVRTVQELISYARANGEKVNCGSHGAGSFNHLACVQFNRLTGAKMTHVPYKGAAQVMTDFLAGRIQVYFAVLTSRRCRRLVCRAWWSAPGSRCTSAPARRQRPYSDCRRRRTKFFGVPTSWRTSTPPARLPSRWHRPR